MEKKKTYQKAYKLDLKLLVVIYIPVALVIHCN